MSRALVTGASKGIGKAIAEQLASRGYDLLLVARSEDLLSQTAIEFGSKYKVEVEFVSIDLSQPDAAQKVYEWCRRNQHIIDILVNNAGYGLAGNFEKYTIEQNTNMIQLNILTLVQMCQLFLPQLREQPAAYILNISSSAAYQAVPYLSLYAATKAFVLSFSRGLRQELKKTNVSVTCVSPGSTDTDFVVRAQISEKGKKTAERVNMTPAKVAKLAVDSMFARKSEVILGIINKLGAFMVWLMPKNLVEKTAMKIYE